MSSNNFSAFSWLTPPTANITSLHSSGSKSPASDTATSKEQDIAVNEIANALRDRSSLSLKMIRNYQESVESLDDQTPMFAEATMLITEIRRSDKIHEIRLEALRENIPHVIYSFNYIEKAGMGFRQTKEICQRILDGEVIQAENIDESSEEYQAIVDHLFTSYKFDPERVDRHLVIQCRREVIQHTKALLHITKAIIVDGESLSEQLIKDTHRILVTGIDRHDIDYEKATTTITPWQKYGGIYRSVGVMAGPTSFVVPKHIPKTMRELTDKFDTDMQEAEITGQVDPFHLAAKYSNLFVLIHPFLDGNGRMCRLILNTLLLKYTGTVVAFGGSDEGREEYFGIVRRASEDLSDDQSEFASFIMNKSVIRLRELAAELQSST